jgi:hypothetical protein
LAVFILFVEEQNDCEAPPVRFRLDCLNRFAEESIVNMWNDDSDRSRRTAAQGSCCFVRSIAKLFDGSRNSLCRIGANVDTP